MREKIGERPYEITKKDLLYNHDFRQAVAEYQNMLVMNMA